MSFYKVPKKIIQEIINIQSIFLWHGKEDKQCINWIKWSNIFKPKDEGDLWVRNILTFNKVLLLKWK